MILLKYKRIFIFLSSLIFAYFLSKSETFHYFMLGFGEMKYIGPFVAGMLYVSTFTVATGIIMLIILAEKISPIELSLIAAVGSVVGDYTILKIINNNLFDGLKPLYKKLKNKFILYLLRKSYFKWVFSLMGAIIIASPFPDEIGISLMGISKINTFKFIILSYLLDAIGIFLLISAISIFV